MLLKLFKIFLKIGALTFGGGYAMIPLVKEECVEKNNWLDEEEFLNMITIAESTPGPVSVNMATYVGYKMEKMPGAIIATIGVVLPSLVIIYIIALFINDLLKIKIIADAFFGIRVAVGVIIARTGFNLIQSESKSSKHKKLTVGLFLVYMLVLFAVELFEIQTNSVLYIVIAIILGIFLLSFKEKLS